MWSRPKYEAGKKMEKDAKVGKWIKKNGKKSIAAAAIVGGLGFLVGFVDVEIEKMFMMLKKRMIFIYEKTNILF